MHLTAKGTSDVPAAPRPRRSLPIKRIVILFLVLAVLAAGAFGIYWLFFRGEEAVVLTETLTSGSLATAIEGTGVTLPADSQSVTVASTAQITKVYVSAGDTVEASDLLYEQDDSELDDQISDYKDQISDLQDDLESAQSQLSDLQKTLSNLTVTAPFSGTVTQVDVETGDEVQRGTRLAVLVDDSKMKLTEYYSYAYEDEIRVGSAAKVSVASLMLNLDGTVTDVQKVSRYTTEGTKCFAVTITVDNPGALTEGMTCASYVLSPTGEELCSAISGALEYNASKTLTAQASGELTQVVPVAYGTVTSGQTLFVLDGSDYRDQLTSAQNKITQTQERIADYQEQIAETEEKRADYAVTAEISGKVIQVGITEGEKPRQAGQTAVVLYNMDTMQIMVNIDELDIEHIQTGMEVAISRSGSSSQRDQSFTGTVTAVSYEATNTNGVAYFPITIEIPSDGALSAGVNVSYSIQVGDTSEGLLAPISALKRAEDGQTCLYIQSDARPENALDAEDLPDGFYAVAVEVGESNSRYARILSGAKEGDVVFTRYQQSAPSGGDSTSQGDESQQEFPNGQMPDFGGGMPGGSMGGGNMGGIGRGNMGGMSGGPMG